MTKIYIENIFEICKLFFIEQYMRNACIKYEILL